MMKSSQEPDQRVEENTPNLDGAEGPRRRLTAQYDPDHVVPVMENIYKIKMIWFQNLRGEGSVLDLHYVLK